MLTAILQKPQATAKNPIVISSSSPRVLSSKTNAPLKTAKESRKRTARKAAEILAEATARISKAEEIRASVNPERKRPEAPDGRVYRGYFTEQDDFVKPVAQSGPPKFKSFGGKKKF